MSYRLDHLLTQVKAFNFISFSKKKKLKSEERWNQRGYFFFYRKDVSARSLVRAFCNSTRGPGPEREPSSGLGIPPERGGKREEEAVCSIWWEPEGSSRVVCCLFSWYTASLGCRRRHVVNPVSVLVVGEITLSKVKQTLCVCVRAHRKTSKQTRCVGWFACRCWLPFTSAAIYPKKTDCSNVNPR